jgi:ABC-type bacteriocin/lantibiotic exporter with double-glycine peptidase domain
LVWYYLVEGQNNFQFPILCRIHCSHFGAQSAGNVFSFAPDMGKAKQAAVNISMVLDVASEIDTWSTEGEILNDNRVEGNIEFINIHFRYPTRHTVPVLRGVNLKFKKDSMLHWLVHQDVVRVQLLA